MLIGEFKNTVGEKNRVAIPKRLRIELESPLYIARGFERSLIIIDRARWQKLQNSISARSMISKSALDISRYIAGGMQQIEPDVQGRFVLPETLKSFAHIITEVVFIGNLNWVELWSAERWNLYLNDLHNNLNGITENLINEQVRT